MFLLSRGTLLVFALACAHAAVFATSPLAQTQVTITRTEIDQAISWGTRTDPAPYLLHHQSPDPGKVNPVIVGAVYTPFVRVALAAKAARDAGRTLDQDDLPRGLLEPLVYVAMRWYCCDDDHGGDLAHFDPSTPFDYKIAVPGRDRFTGSFLQQTNLRLAVPVWVKPAAAVVSDLGGTLPYADIVLVAAYATTAIAPDTDIVIYRDELKPGLAGGYPARQMIIGRITKEDRAAWR